MTSGDPQGGPHFATPPSLIIDASRVCIQSETCGARHGSLYSPATGSRMLVMAIVEARSPLQHTNLPAGGVGIAT